MKRNNKQAHWSLNPWLVLFLFIALSPVTSEAQTFNSGSNGSDGALDFTWAIPSSGTKTVIFDPSDPDTFDPTSPARRLDVDNDNIFHFTTVFIPANVNVYLGAPKLNWAPVYWLATGDVVIQQFGRLNLAGFDGHVATSVGEGRFPAIPGPGGFAGGLGASALNLAQAGFGPGGGKTASGHGEGGGAGHAFFGVTNIGAGGQNYGSPFLLPLVGGSGGAGGGSGSVLDSGSHTGGGAGGGAILIASSTQIVNDGIITSHGGNAVTCCLTGGGGSGGSIRLIAPTIKGLPEECCSTGFIDVRGGSNGGSSGRIRLEAFNQLYQGTLKPDLADSVRIGGLVPTTPFLPTDPRVPKWPSIHVKTINGIDVSQEPSASFAVPDATVSTTGPVSIVFNTKNIKTSAALTFHLVSTDSDIIKVTPIFISGTEANGTWQGTVSFPVGFTRGFLQATWNPPTP